MKTRWKPFKEPSCFFTLYYEATVKGGIGSLMFVFFFIGIVMIAFRKEIENFPEETWVKITGVLDETTYKSKRS